MNNSHEDRPAGGSGHANKAASHPYDMPRFCTTCRGTTPEQHERWRLEDQLRRERIAAKEQRRKRLRALLANLLFWRY